MEESAGVSEIDADAPTDGKWHILSSSASKPIAREGDDAGTSPTGTSGMGVAGERIDAGDPIEEGETGDVGEVGDVGLRGAGAQGGSRWEGTGEGTGEGEVGDGGAGAGGGELGMGE